MFIKMIKDNVNQFPKVLFPSGNFSRVFSQVATSQMCNFSSSNFSSLSQLQRWFSQPVLTAALGPLAHPSYSARSHCTLRHLLRPNHLTFGKLPFGKVHIWKIAAWKIAYLGSGHLSNRLLGSRLQENAFGKVSNTIKPIYLIFRNRQKY